MWEPKQILVATDFSKSSENALMHASWLAARYQARLHVLNVQNVHREMYGLTTNPRFADFEKIIREAASDQMQNFIADFEENVTHRVTYDNHKAQAIMRYAEQHRIDLIVMGAYSRTGIGRLFLGSVTSEVLRIAKVPVLAVKPQHKLLDYGYKKVMLPVDLSEIPENLRWRAMALTTQDNPQLRIVHVIEAEGYSNERSFERAKSVASSQLEKLVKQTALPGEAEIAVLASNKPADKQLAQDAKAFEANLIIMGHARESYIQRRLLGRTIDRVLRRTPCPVLAWRGHEAPKK